VRRREFLRATAAGEATGIEEGIGEGNEGMIERREFLKCTALARYDELNRELKA
jgi:hypothetical protein